VKNTLNDWLAHNISKQVRQVWSLVKEVR
jgi:hypothetical protein